jgi:hypothetical protein
MSGDNMEIQYVGSPESVIKAISHDIREVSYVAFGNLIELQRTESKVDKGFIDMLETSDYFKMLHSEGFVAGMAYAMKRYGNKDEENSKVNL